MDRRAKVATDIRREVSVQTGCGRQDIWLLSQRRLNALLDALRSFDAVVRLQIFKQLIK